MGQVLELKVHCDFALNDFFLLGTAEMFKIHSKISRLVDFNEVALAAETEAA